LFLFAWNFAGVIGIRRVATMDNDVQFMAQALALGRRGLGRTWPNPSVGAVIVRNDGDAPIIVGRAATEPGGRPQARQRLEPPSMFRSSRARITGRHRLAPMPS
jgi:hypothetical protein